MSPSNSLSTSPDNSVSDSVPEEHYMVEEVLGKKTYKNKVYYKLKWFGLDEPSWEEEENCNCQNLISQFESNVLQDSILNTDDNNDWEVEEILDKRMRKNKAEYLVKWSGWPGGPTWEPAELCDCINLIAAYENPKLKKLWDFTGSNKNLWLTHEEIMRYMRRFIKKKKYKVNLLNFKPDYPRDEQPLDLEDGINIGPLAYENHWYLIIILRNHICITTKILIGDSLNLLIGTKTKDHPVMKRLRRIYKNFTIKPIRLTQMDRSDVCAFYLLAAFERAIFLLDSKAHLIVDKIIFDTSRAELIRSKIKPETNGQISATLPIPEAFDEHLVCEFCEKLFESRNQVDRHILAKHIVE